MSTIDEMAGSDVKQKGRARRKARQPRQRAARPTSKPGRLAHRDGDAGQRTSTTRHRQPAPIIPAHSVSRRALLSLVAIMTFLASLTLGAVVIVAQMAVGWQNQIADNVTIQIDPVADNLEARLARAADIAMQSRGVGRVEVLTEEAAAAPLELWLGKDFDRSEIPVPRLIAVQTDGSTDLAALRERLQAEVPGAVLDDHRTWLKRLGRMTQATIAGGVAILLLVLGATALSIVFATRGAMAGNSDVIEVLHLVGAENHYIAREFQRHFMALGLRGAGFGGIAAALFFAAAGVLSFTGGVGSETMPIDNSFGGFQLSPKGYLGIALLILIIAATVALTARWTAQNALKSLS